jgi:hypothetical protein
MKRLMLVAGVLSLLILLPVAAHAVCNKASAEVASVQVLPGPVDSPTAANATIYLRHPSSTSAASFFATTTNLNIINAALNAVHARTKVSITGDAAACPPTAGNIGVISRFTTD